MREAQGELETRVASRTRELEEIGLRHAAILEHAAEGIITSDEEGLIETFNTTAERLFEYQADEVIGKNLKILMGGHDAERHDQYVDNYLQTGKGKILGVRERNLLARRKDSSLFHFELNVAEFFLFGARRFIGTIRDISDRVKAENEAQRYSDNQDLIRAIAQTANEARTVEVAMEECLEAICAHTEWPVGHVFFVDKEDLDLLVSSKIWYLDNPKRFESFRVITEQSTFVRGQGLPGQVLDSGQLAGGSALGNDRSIPRRRVREDTGLLSGFAFPVPVQGRIGAVLEFFSEGDNEV